MSEARLKLLADTAVGCKINGGLARVISESSIRTLRQERANELNISSLRRDHQRCIAVCICVVNGVIAVKELKYSRELTVSYGKKQWMGQSLRRSDG